MPLLLTTVALNTTVGKIAALIILNAETILLEGRSNAFLSKKCALSPPAKQAPNSCSASRLSISHTTYIYEF